MCRRFAAHRWPDCNPAFPIASEAESPNPIRARAEERQGSNCLLDVTPAPKDERHNKLDVPVHASSLPQAAGPMRRMALFGRNLVVVFDAAEYVALIRLRLFHIGGAGSPG